MSFARLTLASCFSLTLFGQTSPDAFADRMIALTSRVQWNAPYSDRSGCQKWIPWQMALQAPDLWSFHCADRANGLIEESFYYLFGEPARSALLRVDLRPEDESPAWTSQLQRALETKLTGQFGAPNREPEIIEIGFRHVRFGEPVAGQHWHTADHDYFLHSNLNAVIPMGVRKGVELIIFQKRLMEERAKDDFIHRVDTLGFATPAVPPKTESERNTVAQETSRDVIALLRRANNASREEKASLLLSANSLVDRLTALFNDEAAAPIRRQLAAFGVRLGGQTHNAGLSYHQDLLWRVFREFPDTEAGERAFLDLQQRGWNTIIDGLGCPANPDLFHEVIERGEAFLGQHPGTRFRKEVLFTLAVANESWWSIAHAPADDEIVNAPPYPRRRANEQQAASARQHAIRYYREIIAIAPDSPEAASARRRLPRIESGLDTGQRRFFCSFC